jgi:hypothetical protein
MSKYEDFTKKNLDWAIVGGGTIFPRSPRTTQNEKNFELGQKIFYFFFICEPFIWANNSFSEIRSNNCARDGFKSQSWAKMSTKIKRNQI